jgi:hypothetical protein
LISMHLGVPSAELTALEEPFTEEEVWAVIVDLPNENPCTRWDDWPVL